MLRAARDAGAHVEQVFVSDELRDEAQSGAPLDSTEVVRVDARTLGSLAQTKTPQGIVAVVGFLDHSANELPAIVPGDGSALVLVLHDLADPGNAGTLLRSAEAFGVHAVCFGPHAVEPYNDKVVRASMGSLFRVPLVRYAEWYELTDALRTTQLVIMAADASGQDVRSITVPERMALLVGQERHGLAEVARSDVQASIGIPQRSAVESLNAGVAGSLLLYECARAQGLLAQAEGSN